MELHYKLNIHIKNIFTKHKININAKRVNSHTTIFINGLNIENKSAKISAIYTHNLHYNIISQLI